MAKNKTKPDLTIGQIERALIKANGLVTVAAKMLGVTQSAITQRVKKSPRLQKAKEDVVEKMLDVAENALHSRMHDEKNLTASIFYLKTKGKHRGYSEKQDIELSGKFEAPITIEWVIVEKEPKKITD